MNYANLTFSKELYVTFLNQRTNRHIENMLKKIKVLPQLLQIHVAY